jgi:S1-C subfamily serine protease
VNFLQKAVLLPLLSACGITNTSSLPTAILHRSPSWVLLTSAPNPIRSFAGNIVSLNVDGRPVGSGSIIDPSRHLILTAGHVAAYLQFAGEDGHSNTFKTKTTMGSIAKIGTIDTALDFALLEYTQTSEVCGLLPMVISKSLEVSSAVTVLGFNIDEQNFYASPGLVTSTGDGVDKSFFEHSADTLPGFSGGAILNASGTVVGIHKGYDGASNLGVMSTAFAGVIASYEPVSRTVQCTE